MIITLTRSLRSDLQLEACAALLETKHKQCPQICDRRGSMLRYKTAHSLIH